MGIGLRILSRGIGLRILSTGRCGGGYLGVGGGLGSGGVQFGSGRGVVGHFWW